MNFSWSYSHYSLALQCLRKFKYVAIDKLIPEAPDSGDLLFGSALHSAINAILLGQDGAATFEIYWGSYEQKEVQYGRYKWGDLAEIGSKFCRNFARLHAKKYKLEVAEKRLYADYQGLKLEGTLDFYGEYDGRKCLRDFKTSGQNYAKEKAQVALQLNLYTYLTYKNGLALPETLGYTVFNKGTGTIQDLTWEFSESRMYEALDNLVAYTRSIDFVNYPKNYNSCLDYNRKCPYFDKCHGEPNEEK